MRTAIGDEGWARPTLTSKFKEIKSFKISGAFVGDEKVGLFAID
jgi:hypothetical protein